MDRCTLLSAFSILQETERLVADSPPGIEAHPHEDNLRYFDVKIRGPDGSAFEGMCALTEAGLTLNRD
jgi:ubiquitin-protein ligase